MKNLYIGNIYSYIKNNNDESSSLYLNHTSIFGNRKINFFHKPLLSDIEYNIYKKDAKLLKLNGFSFPIYILLDEQGKYEIIDSFISDEEGKLFVISTDLEKTKEKIKIKKIKLGKCILKNIITNKSL